MLVFLVFISLDVLVCHVINCKQDLVVPSLMKRGIGFSSSTLSMVPGIPIKPMLARYSAFENGWYFGNSFK
jgi:hypothetical protein